MAFFRPLRCPAQQRAHSATCSTTEEREGPEKAILDFLGIFIYSFRQYCYVFVRNRQSCCVPLTPSALIRTPEAATTAGGKKRHQ